MTRQSLNLEPSTDAPKAPIGSRNLFIHYPRPHLLPPRGNLTVMMTPTGSMHLPHPRHHPSQPRLQFLPRQKRASLGCHAYLRSSPERTSWPQMPTKIILALSTFIIQWAMYVFEKKKQKIKGYTSHVDFLKIRSCFLYLKGSFNNYVDRILPFVDPPPPAWTIFIPRAGTKTEILDPFSPLILST
jgi:hypothetical protein